MASCAGRSVRVSQFDKAFNTVDPGKNKVVQIDCSLRIYIARKDCKDLGKCG